MAASGRSHVAVVRAFDARPSITWHSTSVRFGSSVIGTVASQRLHPKSIRTGCSMGHF